MNRHSMFFYIKKKDLLVLKKQESIYWKKDTEYESRFDIDEIYIKIDENDKFIERLRIVKYLDDINVTVFHTIKTGTTINELTGELSITVLDTENMMSYEDAKSHHFNDDEAFEIIDTIQDIL